MSSKTSIPQVRILEMALNLKAQTILDNKGSLSTTPSPVEKLLATSERALRAHPPATAQGIHSI